MMLEAGVIGAVVGFGAISTGVVAFTSIGGVVVGVELIRAYFKEKAAHKKEEEKARAIILELDSRQEKRNKQLDQTVEKISKITGKVDISLKNQVNQISASILHLNNASHELKVDGKNFKHLVSYLKESIGQREEIITHIKNTLEEIKKFPLSDESIKQQRYLNNRLIELVDMVKLFKVIKSELEPIDEKLLQLQIKIEKLEVSETKRNAQLQQSKIRREKLLERIDYLNGELTKLKQANQELLEANDIQEKVIQQLTMNYSAPEFQILNISPDCSFQ